MTIDDVLDELALRSDLVLERERRKAAEEELKWSRAECLALKREAAVLRERLDAARTAFQALSPTDQERARRALADKTETVH